MHDTDCNCSGYSLIYTVAELNKRRFETKRILAGLRLLAADQSGNHGLLRCDHCGQHWQRSTLSMSTRSYLFKVPPQQDTGAWQAKPFVQPDVLFAWAICVQQYLRTAATFVEQPRLCSEAGCAAHAVRYSVLCAFHHMINIGVPATPPGDYAWCEPYHPEDYRITLEDVNSRPNQKAH